MLGNNSKKAIVTEGLGKRYGGNMALKGVDISLETGSICGLVGTNGAGKSTMLRIVAGIFPQSEGIIRVLGSRPFENGYTKSQIAFIPDVPYFLSGATILKMARFYGKSIDDQKLKDLCERLQLNRNENISNLSKGQKQLAATLLAISRQPSLLIMDETFDGLDPVIRTAVKKIIIDEVQSRGMTVVCASHSLRELEDFCDNLIILHKGEVVMQEDINLLKSTMFKGQIAFEGMYSIDTLANECGFQIISSERNHTLTVFTAMGSITAAKERLLKMSPILLNLQPLSMDEIFSQRVSERGYHFNDILGGEENV